MSEAKDEQQTPSQQEPGFADILSTHLHLPEIEAQVFAIRTLLNELIVVLMRDGTLDETQLDGMLERVSNKARLALKHEREPNDSDEADRFKAEYRRRALESADLALEGVRKRVAESVTT